MTSSGIRIACITAKQLSADAALHGLGVCPGAPGCDGLTVVAFDDVDGRGELLAMSHLHIDGSVAELRQAVHAADNPMTDQVRYAVFATVVAELARRDVLLVVVLRDYLWTPKGVRSFQNLLGYQPVNLRVRLSA